MPYMYSIFQKSLIETKGSTLLHFVTISHFNWRQIVCPGIDSLKPLSVNPTKWSDTFKQFVDELFECV